MFFFSAEKPQLRVAICTIAEDLYNNFEDSNLLRMAKDKGYFGFRTEEDEVCNCITVGQLPVGSGCGPRPS